MEKNNVILNLNPDILKVIPKIIEKEEEVNNNIYSFLLTIFKICKKNNNYSNYLEQYNDDFLEIIKKGKIFLKKKFQNYLMKFITISNMNLQIIIMKKIKKKKKKILN